MNASIKRNTYPLITLIIAVLTLNTVNATTTPVGTKIYPKYSNATSLELVSGSQITVTWRAPSAGTFKIWVQIPAGSNASNASYSVYPKGSAVGNSTCNSTDPAYPCYQITVNQSTVSNGWAQLTLNNLATTSWQFTQLGYVSTSANAISSSEQFGVAQLTYQSVTPAPTLAVGQTYQGGKIFYLDSTRQHGLIAASSDQSTSIRWYNGSNISTGATGTAIGTGKANTTAIVQAQGIGSYAAKLCDDLVLGGYSDWYLPSKDELNELNKNTGTVGGFVAHGDYWSSSEYNFNSALNQTFDYGYQANFDKASPFAVRCVRAF